MMFVSIPRAARVATVVICLCWRGATAFSALPTRSSSSRTSSNQESRRLPSSAAAAVCQRRKTQPICPNLPIQHVISASSKRDLLPTLYNSLSSQEENDDNTTATSRQQGLTLLLFLLVSFFYWYWLVLGAAAQQAGLPFIPEWLPMVPGWPPTLQDLQGPMDDIPHFFYLSELLGKTENLPPVPITRLAVYNLAEAWIFAFLPALWSDPNRLPRPLLLSLWTILGINLTNAFLAPYLLVTQVLSMMNDANSNDNGGDDDGGESILVTAVQHLEKNRIVSCTMGGIASAVALYALYTTLTQTSMADWSDFWETCQADRTYLAFVTDLILFSIFQPLILQRANGNETNHRSIDTVPFVGLMAWLFRTN